MGLHPHHYPEILLARSQVTLNPEGNSGLHFFFFFDPSDTIENHSFLRHTLLSFQDIHPSRVPPISGHISLPLFVGSPFAPQTPDVCVPEGCTFSLFPSHCSLKSVITFCYFNYHLMDLKFYRLHSRTFASASDLKKKVRVYLLLINCSCTFHELLQLNISKQNPAVPTALSSSPWKPGSTTQSPRDRRCVNRYKLLNRLHSLRDN